MKKFLIYVISIATVSSMWIDIRAESPTKEAAWRTQCRQECETALGTLNQLAASLEEARRSRDRDKMFYELTQSQHTVTKLRHSLETCLSLTSNTTNQNAQTK